MIITKTPLRISLGGGGTDLPSYYRHSGGFVLSAAINKYVYLSVNKTFTQDYLIKYSELERVEAIADVKHPIVRTALDLLGIQPGIEIVSVADIPAGTGLGSSGSFTVGLLNALSVLEHLHLSTHDLAELACRIEIDFLHEPVGKQDQYIAAYGGISCLDIDTSGVVTVTRLKLPESGLRDLESNLLLFFTGYSRSAGSILRDQSDRSEQGDIEMRRNLDETMQLGIRIKEELSAGNIEVFGELLNEHWERKRTRSRGMSNSEIDDLYQLGINNGAIGGKLVGAGAGGFLLFYAKNPQQLRDCFRKHGIREVPFTFDHDGSTLLTRS